MKTSEQPFCAGCYDAGLLRTVTGRLIRPGGLTLTDRAIEYCAFATGARILDVGCGTGATVEHLCSHHGFIAQGVDRSQAMIDEGVAHNPALSLIQAAAEKLPFAGDTYDGVICECVLSLLDEPLKALLEFKRVVRSGGYLILSDIYPRGTEGNDGGAQSRSQIEPLLLQSGITPLLWEDHTQFLRELAARLILAHGSLNGFYGTDCARQRLGYYLLIARKA